MKRYIRTNTELEVLDKCNWSLDYVRKIAENLRDKLKSNIYIKREIAGKYYAVAFLPYNY